MRTGEILRKAAALVDPAAPAGHTRLTCVAVAPRPRLSVRTVSAVAAAGGALAGVALQRRHRRSLARDPDYARLTRPLGGRPLPVVSADGTRLHAEVFGPAGGHTVVLAHGWTEQMGFWGPVIDVLVQRGERVVAYDLRGHGRSEAAADADYALERFGEDIAAVLAACAIDDDPAPTVVGHSLGAMSIVAWAADHDVAAALSTPVSAILSPVTCCSERWPSGWHIPG
jgi:predicted alpha/beta-fold hydrolase